MTRCSSSNLRPRALIVEDEVLIALGLEADLQDLGFASEQPDVVLMGAGVCPA
jgi:hypothetical protein